eukprot:m.13017 g.13017  ORF g.13017 m.13017 type:complete len:55 (+) comp9556_c0_seq1:1325-1489(+)
MLGQLGKAHKELKEMTRQRDVYRTQLEIVTNEKEMLASLIPKVVPNEGWTTQTL